jgi:hypothetical protein
MTCERAWLDNQPKISCIPSGDYSLVPHLHGEKAPTWALVGETVSHMPEAGKARSAILLHAANWPHELQGCIAPGRFLGAINVELGVSSSQAAMSEILGVLEKEPRHTMEIRWRTAK